MGLMGRPVDRHPEPEDLPVDLLERVLAIRTLGERLLAFSRQSSALVMSSDRWMRWCVLAVQDALASL